MTNEIKLLLTNLTNQVESELKHNRKEYKQKQKEQFNGMNETEKIEYMYSYMEQRAKLEGMLVAYDDIEKGLLYL